MSDEIIPVALGSWFFTLDLEASTTIKPSEFFARVGSCLEAIQGVDALRIDLMALPGEDTPLRWEPTAKPRYGEYVGPHWNFESVSFSLRLPYDVQGELLKPHRFVTGYEAEHFRVVFMYGWAMPLSCVASLDSRGADTSQGAVAVYRYLQRETERSAEKIRVRSIPPIFAHADVLLVSAKPDSSDGASFRPVEHSLPTHHRYEIGFDSSLTHDPIVDFLHEVGSELDLYYQVVHSEGERRSQWEEIDELMAKVTELRGASGVLGTVKRFFETDRLTSKAIIGLTEFAAGDQVAGADFRRQFRNTYAAGRQHFIRELVESELSDREEYPVEQFSRLVNLLEQRRLTDREMIVIVMASLIAGAVGATATLLAAPPN